MASPMANTMKPSKNILQEVQHNANRNIPKSLSKIKRKHHCLKSTSESGVTQDENMEKGKALLQSTYHQNISRVRESEIDPIVTDFKTISKIITSYLIQLNISHHYLSSSHIPIYFYTSKVNTKSKELRSKDSLCISVLEDEGLSIVSKKIGSFKVLVSEKRNRSRFPERQPSSDDRIIALESLEWLQLRIQLYVYPNHATLGLMFRNHVLKCPFSDVSDRALSIFLGVVHLHPPYDKRMRDYYLKVFNKASSEAKPSPLSQYRGWSFVSILVKDLLAETKGPSYDVRTALDYVTQLLELDMVHYNKSPISATALLSHRVFWVREQQKSVVNEAVRQLIQFWIRTARASHSVRRKVTKLLCIMLEMVWKWCDVGSPFLLAEWPLCALWMPLAEEFMAQFKEMKNGRLALLLVEGVTVPWQQMLLSSLALRSLAHSTEDDLGHLSLPSLKSHLKREVRRCHRAEDEAKVLSHAVRVRFLVLLIVSYVHATGVKFCQSASIRHFHQKRNVTNALHTPNKPSVKKEESSKRHRSERSNSSCTNNSINSIPSKSFVMEVSCDKKRKLEGCPASASGETDDRFLADMVSRSMILLGQMQHHITDLNALKGKCSHICDSYFTLAL